MQQLVVALAGTWPDHQRQQAQHTVSSHSISPAKLSQLQMLTLPCPLFLYMRSYMLLYMLPRQACCCWRGGHAGAC